MGTQGSTNLIELFPKPDLSFFCSQTDFYRNNSAFLFSDDIKSLLAPLACYGINYLTYEFYNQLGHFRLTTHPDWIDHYYRNGLFKVAAFENSPLFQNEGVVYWQDLEDKPVYNNARDFDIASGFTLFFGKDMNTHLLHFGRSRKEKCHREHDIKNMGFYRQFADYFLDQTAKIRLKSEMSLAPNFLMPQPLASKDTLALIAGSTLVSTKINFNSKPVCISDKEAYVALGLLRGLLVKQIAHELTLSDKSIKNYISSLKKKLGVSNLVQLGLALDRITISNTTGNIICDK